MDLKQIFVTARIPRTTAANALELKRIVPQTMPGWHSRLLPLGDTEAIGDKVK